MRPMRTLLTPLILAWLTLPRGVPAQLLPLGVEFQLNAYTTNAQASPRVDADPVGNFVVVWQSLGQDGSNAAVIGRRFGADGQPMGGEFPVNSYTTGDQRHPVVMVDAEGNFVVIWESFGQDGDSTGIFGARFDTAGAPLGGEFQVNTYTTGSQVSLDASSDALGNFVVVWHDGQDGGATGVVGRRIDATGAPAGAEFQVNTHTTSFQSFPAIAVDAAGGFVVVWESSDQDGSGRGVFGQRYDANGMTLGGEFQVNTYTTFGQSKPAVAPGPGGTFVVAWESDYQVGSDGDIFAQRYDSAGAALGSEFQVNAYTTGDQTFPALAIDGAGNFVVTWTSYMGADSEVRGRHFEANGAPLGGDFQVNTYTSGYQYGSAVAADPAGNFVLAWTSYAQDPDPGVFAQRHGTGRPILGRKMVVKDRTGSELGRLTVVLGKETSTDIGDTILGDPLATGATLRIIARGTTDSDQTFLLDAAGWTAIGNVGFRYLGPTGADGDPVKKLVLTRGPGGEAKVKVVLKGNVGTQSLDLVPPNLGDEGGLILTIPGGGIYCTGFGGAAGGSETLDDDRGWKMLTATAEGCPTP